LSRPFFATKFVVKKSFDCKADNVQMCAINTENFLYKEADEDA